MADWAEAPEAKEFHGNEHYLLRDCRRVTITGDHASSAKSSRKVSSLRLCFANKSVRTQGLTMQHVHNDDEGHRVGERERFSRPLRPAEETDIAYRGSNGFSTGGSSGSNKTALS
jgi:hypothetical protein